MFQNPQVNYYVNDAEASARFYREAFGFEETFRTPDEGAPIHIEVRLGGLVLGFATFDSLRDLHGVITYDGPPRSEVAIWTEDVDAAYETLIGGGASSLSPPHDFLGL